jgi:hypothetical protein
MEASQPTFRTGGTMSGRLADFILEFLALHMDMDVDARFERSQHGRLRWRVCATDRSGERWIACHDNFPVAVLMLAELARIDIAV